MTVHRPRFEVVTLRPVREDDVGVFFENQLDEGARRMAAFGRENPLDREGFLEHWEAIRADDANVLRTVVADGRVAGHVGQHWWRGDPVVGYWIGREFWGDGVATRALRALLAEVTVRPLHAGVVVDNLASLRVLERCGFRVHDRTRGYAQGRGEEVEELLLVLDAAPA